ncbi:MAG TPA: peptidoglycan DD-metalloendopeptidase family protein, partial [bacterium]|nr:peptidoglycan DD-metalloendopeptidase family protein [bacterium]
MKICRLLILAILFPISAFAEATKLTPITVQVLTPQIQAVRGSDGWNQLVYEIQVSNISSETWRVESVAALAEGKPLGKLSGKELESRLGPLSSRGGSSELGPRQVAFLWMHLKLPAKTALPRGLQHRIELSGPQSLTMEGGKTTVSQQAALAISPPLRGGNWLAGDGCCDSVRHVRATLPLDGRLATSQRFAIDWEKLDQDRRVFAGDPKNPEHYFCYGQEVLAVANAEVVAALDGLPNQVPGKLPASIDLAQADGNHVILRLDSGHYALYAHLKPGSVRVKAGDKVQTGQVLGLVGNSGNTSEPHLH